MVDFLEVEGATNVHISFSVRTLLILGVLSFTGAVSLDSVVEDWRNKFLTELRECITFIPNLSDTSLTTRCRLILYYSKLIIADSRNVE